MLTIIKKYNNLRMFHMVYKPLPLQRQISWRKGKAIRALTLDRDAAARGRLEGTAV